MIIPLPWAGGIAAIALLAGVTGGYRYASGRCAAEKVHALEEAQKRFDAALAKQGEVAATYEQERADAANETYARNGAIRTVYRTRTVRADCALQSGELLERARSDANSAATGVAGRELPGDTAAP